MQFSIMTARYLTITSHVYHYVYLQFGGSVKTATCLNSDKRHGHNGDKIKWRNPKRRQEMVGLCEAFKQLFRAYNRPT